MSALSPRLAHEDQHTDFEPAESSGGEEEELLQTRPNTPVGETEGQAWLRQGGEAFGGDLLMVPTQEMQEFQATTQESAEMDWPMPEGEPEEEEHEGSDQDGTSSEGYGPRHLRQARTRRQKQSLPWQITPRGGSETENAGSEEVSREQSPGRERRAQARLQEINDKRLAGGEKTKKEVTRENPGV